MIALALPPAPAPQALGCRIEVPAEWLAWPGRDAALARLRELLAHWWTAWELPVVPALSWAEAAHGDASAARLMADDDAGLFVRLPAMVAADAESVALALFAGAVAHRAAWLGDELLGTLGVAPADRALVREGARRGFAPRRFIGQPADDAALAPAARCDRCIDASALRLRLQMADPSLCEGQAGDNEPWAEMTELLGDALFYESGMLLPMLELEADAGLPPHALRVWVNDLPLPPQAGLPAGSVMVNESPARLRLLGIDAEPLPHPAEDKLVSAVAAAQVPKLAELGLTTWGPGGYALLAVVHAARRHAPALWTATATEAALARMAEGFPFAAAAWRARFALPLLSDVLRALLAEGVSIRNLRAILEAMLAVRSVAAVDATALIVFAPASGRVMTVDAHRPVVPATPDAATLEDWVSQVRCALARQITHQHTRGQSTLVVHLLEPEVEQQLRDQPQSFETAEGHARLFGALHEAIGSHATGQAPVLLTTKGVRPLLHRLLAAELPELVVLAYEELSPDASIQPLGRIALSSAGT